MSRALLFSVIAVVAIAVVAALVLFSVPRENSSGITTTVVQQKHKQPLRTSTAVMRKLPKYPHHIGMRQLCRSPIKHYNIPIINAGTRPKSAIASTFYIHEPAGSSNAGISNVPTAWDDLASKDYGVPDGWGPINGVSGPTFKRRGLCPAAGIPKEGLAYVAIQVVDHDGRIYKKAFPWVKYAARFLPQLRKFKDGHFADWQSPFKNLWVEVHYHGLVAYGQVEDTGPSKFTDGRAADFPYVFGRARHTKNRYGLHAGIDLSPALTDYLGTDGGARVTWRIIPSDLVPNGWWKDKQFHGPPNWL
jgi:hypothetical protein